MPGPAPTRGSGCRWPVPIDSAARFSKSNRAQAGERNYPNPCKASCVNGHPESIESISAVTLLTADMVNAVAFYRALGFHLLYGGPEATFTSFRVGGGYLNLQVDVSGCPGGAWGRIVLWVDDVDALYERAVAAGFPPDTSPTDASWGERYFHIHDPSGHELSFARPLPK
jgi:catechol 2,3-dioxygenase-like lactoylglutathione lyase family enzyme